jgi:DNA-binding transcriptional LysR family regulator
LYISLLDLIVTPQKGAQKNLEYRAFSHEKIVLIAGSHTDTAELGSLLKKKHKTTAATWLKQQLWYSTTGDMEHLKNFWINNFGEHPDFKPNYIVPNISSIVRCLNGGNGFSIVPNFLCQEELDAGKIKLVWEGDPLLINTLYFSTRKNTLFKKELSRLENIFQEKWNKA